MPKTHKVPVVDVHGNDVGTLGSKTGASYVAVDREKVTWFVPDSLLEPRVAAASRLRLEPESIAQIDLFPVKKGVAAKD